MLRSLPLQIRTAFQIMNNRFNFVVDNLFGDIFYSTPQLVGVGDLWNHKNQDFQPSVPNIYDSILLMGVPKSKVL